MKKTILLHLLFISIGLFAQPSNLVLYSESGDRFNVLVNGVLQNPQPMNNLRLTGIAAPVYQVRIIFENQFLGFFDNTISQTPGVETTFSIGRSFNGLWALRMVGEVPILNLQPGIFPNQTVIVYHSEPFPGMAGGTTTTTTTTTTYTDPYLNDNLNVNFDFNGGGMNMNFFGPSGFSQQTTTTTINNGFGNPNALPPQQQTTVFLNDPYYQQQPFPQQPWANHQVQQGWTSPAPVQAQPLCMDASSFANARNSIASNSFESTKLQVAKQILGSNCFTSMQVREVMTLFSFESSRLEFAKFAYPSVPDKQNFYLVNDVFNFESSIGELNQFTGTIR